MDERGPPGDVGQPARRPAARPRGPGSSARPSGCCPPWRPRTGSASSGRIAWVLYSRAKVASPAAKSAPTIASVRRGPGQVALGRTPRSRGSGHHRAGHCSARSMNEAIRSHIATGLAYMGQCPLAGSRRAPPRGSRAVAGMTARRSPARRGTCVGTAARGTVVIRSPWSDRSTIDSKMPRTAPGRTLCRKLAAYRRAGGGRRPGGPGRRRRRGTSRRPRPGWSAIWRLRKQSSGARLPSMSTKLRTRPGCRSASSKRREPAHGVADEVEPLDPGTA